jgi:hypothetical protein
MKTLKTISPVLEVIAFLVILASLSFPQAAVLGENCDLAVLGGAETKSFVAFDRELRSSLSRQDAAVMALLVKYPLRINDDRGSYYLDDAESLQSRFQEIFPRAVRDAVLKQGPETVSCTSSGIMYGDGVVWVNPKGDRYAVATVNLPEGTHSSKTQIAGRVEFVCDADKHRVIVDTEANGAPHYRAWNKPRSLTEKPDMEISKGKKDYEGSGPCAQIIWTFTTGVTKFVVEGPGGCHEDSHQPPADTQGRLKVSTPGTPDVSWWCR